MYYDPRMWTHRDRCLVREVSTPDFLSAFRIVESLVGPAEAVGHHPDVSFGWGYVRITLTTHDQGGVTELDHALAAEFDKLLPR